MDQCYFNINIIVFMHIIIVFINGWNRNDFFIILTKLIIVCRKHLIEMWVGRGIYLFSKSNLDFFSGLNSVIFFSTFVVLINLLFLLWSS